MKRVLVLSIAYCLFTIASSCNYSNEWQSIKTANEFSVSIPEWMDEEKELKAGAPFQYANRYRNFYSIGESIAKDDSKRTLEEWNRDCVKPTIDVLKDALFTDSSSTQIEGKRAIHTELFGKLEGETIYYSHISMEGKKRLIHLCVWTRGEERKLKYKEDIQRILFSLREL